MIRFTVYGEAQPAGSKRAFIPKGWNRPVVVDANAKARPWKELVAASGAEAMRKRFKGYSAIRLLEGPLRLAVTFYRPRPKSHFGKKGLKASAPAFPETKPDATKLLRAVEDALTGIIWRDDAQVCFQVVRKVYGEPARVDVQIDKLSPMAETVTLTNCLTGEK